MNHGADGAVHELRGLLCASAPPEPESLRAELRALAGDDPSAASPAIVGALCSELWPAWRVPLVPFAVSSDDLGHVLAADGREAWLWVMGERNWAHTVEGLAGRVARRLGSGPADEAHEDAPEIR